MTHPVHIPSTPLLHVRLTPSEQPLDASQVTTRSMNFGQRWRSPHMRIEDELPLRVEIPRHHIASLLHDDVTDWLDDDHEHPDPHDPLATAYREGAWDDAASALHNKRFLQCAAMLFAREALLSCLGDGPVTTSPGYVINHVVGVSIHDALVCFEVTAAPAEHLVAFQDV